MDRRIASPELRNDPDSRVLIDRLESISKSLDLTDPVAYYDFPMFRDDQDELLRSQTMFASRETGLVFFSTTHSGEAVKDLDERLVQLDALAYGRLVKNARLRRDKRTLAVEVGACIFAPGVAIDTDLQSSVVSSDVALQSYLSERVRAPIDDETWNELISTIEGASALRREKEKGLATAPEGTMGNILGKIYSRIASFDNDQRRAAITLVEGPQRIRGIAGSGKTVVLAMKAAHIHLIKPEAEILITFWTKSLYDQFKYLVSRFYRQFSDADPDWSKVHILHAWGGRSAGEGVYYNAALAANVPPMKLSDLKRIGQQPNFGAVCEDLLKSEAIEPAYDYCLIDEGQDLPASFYRLCFELTRGKSRDRNVIWAYDELQTILDVSVQNVPNTFGYLSDGTARMDLERAEDVISRGLQPHDIVLKRSYRNSPQVLVAAHALGFGIYSDQIVQILENSRHWEDLGYEIVEGECAPGKKVTIRRPKEYSPVDISQYLGAGNVIEAKSFTTFKEEVSWVVREFKKFLSEGLRPQDLLVVSLDDRNSKLYFSEISKHLLDENISVNNLSIAPFSTPNFFIDGAATLSTVYKAKGNEAAAVFVVGVDALAYQVDEVRARNKLFAAMTRSKAWLRLSGTEPHAGEFVREVNDALKNYPELVFTYPDPRAVRTIQRDLAERSAKLGRLQKMIEELGITNLSKAEIDGLLGGSETKLGRNKKSRKN